jgi:hypothetical protein
MAASSNNPAVCNGLGEEEITAQGDDVTVAEDEALVRWPHGEVDERSGGGFVADGSVFVALIA